MDRAALRALTYTLIVLSILFSTIPLFCSAAQADDNGKVAVIINSAWNFANGWPQTDYLNILRETTSALDFLGYRYDVVDEKISQQDLNHYAMVISVASESASKVAQFAKSTGRTVLILYELSSELADILGIKLGDYVKETEGTPRITEENSLTRGIVSQYGFLPFWGAYENDFGFGASVLLESPQGRPIIVEMSGAQGRYIFLLTRALTWNGYSYIFLDNVLQEATALPRVGGIPYAMDVPIMIRLDDYCDWTPAWEAYTSVSKKLTAAAIMNATNAKELSKLAQRGVEIFPHGNNHEDLSLLSYDEQKEVIASAIQKFEEYTGIKPSGYYSPYNRINDETTRVCSELGLKWVTTYPGMGRVPRYHYRDHPNKVWVLGNRPEHFEEKEAVKKALEEGVIERKPLLFVEHPYARNNEGKIDVSVATLRCIVNFAGSTEGVYMTQIGEFFKKLDEQSSVYCIGDTLFVEEDVEAGLTFVYPNRTTNQIIQLGDRVLMFYRNDAAVLPALEKGNYTVKLVEKMPVLKPMGPGVVVRSAVYDVSCKTSKIELEAVVDKESLLEIDNMPSGKYLAKLQSETWEAVVNISVNGNGKIELPIKLYQDIPVQVTIYPQ